MVAVVKQRAWLIRPAGRNAGRVGVAALLLLSACRKGRVLCGEDARGARDALADALPVGELANVLRSEGAVRVFRADDGRLAVADLSTLTGDMA